ncbi:peroxiredoxin [Methylomicrobium sp. RS1]|jgi:peroxiredoxin Q/BCP|uniref:peroxiredoxin n=1 Tax=Candidatus Methylomicrobium oryzae TaxID=2802053 RepID=UPI001923CBE6|nr:peroxiredoxin [Methylomicrobium sp. RS1]MBL1263756.1 peroxiredoxin [Methylomicrobium sp. RS1]
MTPLTLGNAAPDLEIQSTGGKTVRLTDYAGQNVVLYFYPKDNTPGCTQEGCDFRDLSERFAALNTVVFGVSRDSVKMHEGFKSKQAFPFELLSDPEEMLCGLFDVIRMKNMYGKQVRGIERSTFLFDSRGILVREWRKVKVKDHVREVLLAVEGLN